MPVFLHKFSVAQLGAEHLVQWTTEMEANVGYYELQRSKNGIDFSAISTQVATNSGGANNYSYSDNSFSPGVNYYRLKISERDGLVKYSIIIRTETQPQTELFRIVPNPVTGDEFSLLFSSAGPGIATITINDVTGRPVHTVKEGINSGQNVIYIKAIPGLLPGMYFVSVTKRQNKTG
jgi:hypothetical protein